MVAGWLVRVTGNDYVPAYYAMLAALVGLVAVLLMQETSGRPLEGSAPTISTDEAHGQQTAAAVAQ